MKLEHQIEVDASTEEVWAFLQDTHAVAQCLPGADLVDELGDDRYEGLLRITIGPLKMNYAGDVSVVERNAESLRMMLDANGRDKRGSGAVQAHVWLQVEPGETGCRIEVVSDLDLSGRIASLGRGVRDVSNRMFVEFADQLSNRIEGTHPNTDKPASTSAPASANGGEKPASMSTTRTLAATPATVNRAQTMAGEMKILPLLWTVTRSRFADLLDRLSARVRPR